MSLLRFLDLKTALKDAVIYIYKSNGKTVSRDSVGAELFTDPPYISQRRGGVS